MIFVLYHANCLDGAGSKYAASLAFGDRATYLPVQYGKPLPPQLTHLTPQELASTEVYILDFSYDRQTLVDLNSRVAKLVVLDHHVTAQAELEGLDFATFELKKSGATMTYSYLFPGAPIPKVLLHVEDRDLWKFELPGTRDVMAVLNLDRENLQHWEQIRRTVEHGGPSYEVLLKQGRAINRHVDQEVKSAVAGATPVVFRNYRVAVTNAVTNISEIGGALCGLDVDFSMTYFITRGRVVWSFRSRSDFDVSRIALSLGGGGHRQAAGASTDLQFLQSLLAGELDERQNYREQRTAGSPRRGSPGDDHS